MSVTLKIDNFASTNIKEQSTLAERTGVGAASIKLANNDNMVAGDFILIGSLGSETGEITTVQSSLGATLATVNPLKLEHAQNELVTALLGDAIKLYRAADSNGLQPADGDFSHIQTIPIDPDQLSTTVVDAAGGSGYWYKYTYFNSSSTAETAIADSTAARGGGASNYVTLDAIRNEAGFKNNRNISDATIDLFRRQAQDEVNGQLSGQYEIPFPTNPTNGTIQRITMLLAAGFLQVDQYGPRYNTNAQGVNTKVAEARATIERIRTGELRLTNAVGVAQPETDGLGFSGFPNSSTADPQTGDNDFMFKRESIDGYNGREY